MQEENHSIPIVWRTPKREMCQIVRPIVVPRAARETSKKKGLRLGLGQSDPTDMQQIYSTLPKKLSSATTQKPDLLVDGGNLPATARGLRDILVKSECLFDRGVPVKVVQPRDGGAPVAERLTVNGIVVETHD